MNDFRDPITDALYARFDTIFAQTKARREAEEAERAAANERAWAEYQQMRAAALRAGVT